MWAMCTRYWREAPVVRAYARGPEFAARNAQDLTLWRAAVARIDEHFATSASLSRTLTSFRDLQARASSLCTPEYNSTERLDRVSECYYLDQGCNYKCLDELRFPSTTNSCT